MLGEFAICAALLLGFALGARLRHRLGNDRFRTLLLVMFLIVGLNLLLRALF